MMTNVQFPASQIWNTRWYRIHIQKLNILKIFNNAKEEVMQGLSKNKKKNHYCGIN